MTSETATDVGWRDAVAYLKAKIAPSDDSPAVELDYSDSPVLDDLGIGLVVAYVVDRGTSFSYVQNRHLSAAEATVDELRVAGRQNLRTIADAKLRIQPYGPIYAVLMDGNFEASLLLLDDLWDVTFREYVRGEYLAAAPSRDVLSFCDATSATGLAELRAVVERVYRPNAQYMLTPHILRRAQRSWVYHDGA